MPLRCLTYHYASQMLPLLPLAAAIDAALIIMLMAAAIAASCALMPPPMPCHDSRHDAADADTRIPLPPPLMPPLPLLRC